MNKSNNIQACKKAYQPLQDLNLIDAFLFAASTEKNQDAEFIAKLIIERATNEKVDGISVVSEKELTGIDISHHGIRMDLYVEEFPELMYNDGVKKLFLYVGGKLGGTEKLKSLLQYFSDSNTRNVTDADLEHLHSIVENAKHNQEVGKRYMTLQDMIDYEKKESFEDGIALGREEGRNEARREGVLVFISFAEEMKLSAGQIREQLMQKFSLTAEEAEAYLNENN